MENFNQTSSVNVEYCRASMAKRFANYLIDLSFFYLIIFFLVIILELLIPGTAAVVENIDGIIDRLITLVLFGFVMFIIEGAFGGKSIGKLITKTRAVNIDGSNIDIAKAFTRNIIRAVPFDTLSALGSPCKPWHDQWSHTIVVDDNKLDLELRREDFFENFKKDGASDNLVEEEDIEVKPI